MHPPFGQFLFPSVLWQTDQSDLHLTFDDGPHPVATPLVLKVLKAKKVRAAFFLIGRNVQLYPDLAKQILEEGHIVCNHTFDHATLFFRPSRFIEDQLKMAEDAILSATGFRTTLFRPPFGYFGFQALATARQRGYRMVMWTHDSGDFRNRDSRQILKGLERSACPGSILLFHDNHHTQRVIGELVDRATDRLHDRGYAFAPLTSDA